MSRVIRNAARCRKCGDEITSEHRHDFKYCECGAIFVDGGHDYIRRGGDIAAIDDLSVVEDELPPADAENWDSLEAAIKRNGCYEYGMDEGLANAAAKRINGRGNVRVYVSSKKPNMPRTLLCDEDRS